MFETVQCAGADFCEELSGSGDTSFTRLTKVGERGS